MKVVTIFYSVEGKEAIRRVSAIRAENGPESAFVLHADGYAGEPIRGDEIEFLDCVPEWKREQIRAAFAEQQERRREAKEAEDARRSAPRPVPVEITGEDQFRRSLSSRPATSTPTRKRPATSQNAELPGV